MTDLTTPGLSLLAVKPWPFFGYAPGNHMGKCLKCSTVKSGLAKRAISCLECAVISAKQFIDEQNDEPAARPTLANEGVVEAAARDFVAFELGWHPDALQHRYDRKIDASDVVKMVAKSLASVRPGVTDGELRASIAELFEALTALHKDALGFVKRPPNTGRGKEIYDQVETALTNANALLARLTEGGSR